MVEVEVARYENPEALASELEHRQSPLVIRDAVAAWPAVQRWTAGYLSARLGSIEIPFKTSSGNAHPDFRQEGLGRMFARSRAPLSEFLERITAGPESERCRYLFTGDEQFLIRRRSGVESIDPALAPLLEDIETPPLFAAEQLHTVWAWLSGPGVRTWLHYDNNACHNLNAQVAGRKRCVLYAPEELPRLHPFPLGGGNPAYNCSRIDVERPQVELADDLAAARGWHAELGTGDLLFIPAWWFHTFEHLGAFNANVNFWWKPVRPRWNVVAARQALLDAAAAASLDLRDPGIASVLGALDAAALRRTGL